MLAYHIAAAITVCIIIIGMAIPLTRDNRLAAMRESDERITSIFHTLPACSCEAPCVICPIVRGIDHYQPTQGSP